MNEIVNSKYVREGSTTLAFSFLSAVTSNVFNYKQFSRIIGMKFEFSRIFSAGFGSNWTAHFVYMVSAVTIHKWTIFHLKKLGCDEESLFIRHISANITGFIEGILNAPSQVLGAHQIRKKCGLLEAIALVYQSYGWKGFFRAFYLSSLKDMAVMNITLETTPRLYSKIEIALESQVAALFISSLSTSIPTAMLFQPVNFIRVHLQASPNQSLINVVSHTYRNLGATAFWRGTVPRILAVCTYNVWQIVFQSCDENSLITRKYTT